ncbi:MAG TPA: Sec-independent protein translocase protein TatB [Polyangiaceae bacterium]|nr:Sec-independent protein translocase protein TatB [Polyangiaceae bacterium]
MFGLSFSELVVIGVVALVAVGPQKLPGMLRTLGHWLRKLRIMTQEVRNQTGIDELLRAEGLHGGLTELRSLIRGQAPAYTPPYVPPPPPPAPAAPEPAALADDPYANVEVDPTREYPPEGPDAYGALPDDLLESLEEPALAVPEARSENGAMGASAENGGGAMGASAENGGGPVGASEAAREERERTEASPEWPQ